MQNYYTQTVTDTPPVADPIALHALVNNLMKDLLPRAVDRKSLILNDVARDFEITADEQVLASVLWSLANLFVSHSQNGCIHVAASALEEAIRIELKDNHTLFGQDAPCPELDRIQPLLNELDGCVSFHQQAHAGSLVQLTLATKTAKA